MVLSSCQLLFGCYKMGLVSGKWLFKAGKISRVSVIYFVNYLKCWLLLKI